MTAAGQDGERLVERALIAWHRVFVLRESYGNSAMFMDAMRAALAAIAPDLDRAGYERARRECADELRALADQVGQEKVRHRGGYLTVSPLLAGVLDALADSWSSSGRAPAGEEKQR